MSSNDRQDGGVDRFSVKIQLNGYNVEVEIHQQAIRNELQRVEQKRPGEINRKGMRAFDLSKFASVCAVPTERKWDELSESAGVTVDAE